MSGVRRHPFVALAIGAVLFLVLAPVALPMVERFYQQSRQQSASAVAVNESRGERVGVPTAVVSATAITTESAGRLAGEVYRVQTSLPVRDESLRLEGPAKAKPGQLIRLQLLGTPPVDVAKPLIEQLGWASSMQMKVLSAQEGAILDGNLVVAFPLSLQLRLEFTAEKPGDYWVVVDWNYEKPQLLVHRITVEGTQPTPGPTPDPTPGPTPDPTPPPGLKYAVIVEESSQRTPAAAAIIKDPGLRDWVAKAGHVLRVADKDSQVPADLEPYVKLAAGKRLPRLIVVDKITGKVLVDTDLPGTVEQVKTLIGPGK